MQFENTSRPVANQPVSRQSPQQVRQSTPVLKPGSPPAKGSASGSNGLSRSGSATRITSSGPGSNSTAGRSATGSTIQKPMQSTGSRQPVSSQTRPAVNSRSSRYNTTRPAATTIVKGWPSAVAAGIGKQGGKLFRGSLYKQRISSKPVTGAVKKMVTGWPHLKQVAGKMLPKNQGIAPQNLRSSQPHRWRYWQAGRIMKPGVVGNPVNPATASQPVQNRNGQYLRQRYPGRTLHRPYYGPGYRPPSVYVNNVAPAADGGHVTGTGWAGLQQSTVAAAQSCSCGHTAQGGANTQTGASPVQSAGTCQHCGESSLGCATISRFSFNSTKLKQHHKVQLKELATRIISGVKAVVAIGHTDTSGPEKYNDDLGYRRAMVVVNELRRELNQLKPNADRPVFWRIDSAGESQPLPGANAANSRRVEICLKQAGV